MSVHFKETTDLFGERAVLVVTVTEPGCCGAHEAFWMSIPNRATLPMIAEGLRDLANTIDRKHRERSKSHVNHQ